MLTTGFSSSAKDFVQANRLPRLYIETMRIHSTFA
jgi:hypothetical protein